MDWLNYLSSFLLIFIRVLAFFTVMPILSYRTIPNVHKIGLALYLAWIMVFAIDAPIIPIDSMYFLLIVKEVLVGLLIGLIAAIILYGVQVAGSFIDAQMGLMIASVIDPQTGGQTPLIGGYLYTFALLFLLVVDGHHLLLDGIFYSYEFIPLQQLILPLGNEAIAMHVLTSFNGMFIIAFQMAFPVVACLFLVDVALGMVSRSVPQMNVFVVGLPLKLLVGFPLLVLAMPLFFMSVQQMFEKMLVAMRTLMHLLGGG